MSSRLDLALNSGLSLSQPLTVLAPTPDHDLSDLPREAQMVQPFKPFHDHFAAQGFAATPESDAPCHDAIVFLPRAKALARALVSQACKRASGTIVANMNSPVALSAPSVPRASSSDARRSCVCR